MWSGQAVDQEGVVKSWNGSKGFGFITAPGVEGDVMFTKVELPPDAKEVRGKFLEGRSVLFDLGAAANGRLRATRVHLLAGVGEGEFMVGQIKSFSQKNGYGFISSSMCEGIDSRFQSSDLDDLLPGARLEGQLVLFSAQILADGKQRVNKLMFQSNAIAQHLKASPFQGAAQAPRILGMKRAAAGVAPAWGVAGGFKGKVAVTPTGQYASGVVKSYSVKKGFGFISSEELGQDVFFMMSDLPKEVRETPEALIGQEVQFELVSTAEGKLRARSVTGMAGEEWQAPVAAAGAAAVSSGRAGYGGGGPTKRQKSGPVSVTSTGQYVSGVVKSYSVKKGFGFISSEVLDEDVFFMTTDLPSEVRSREDLRGEAVGFELGSTKDGKLRATNIVSE